MKKPSLLTSIALLLTVLSHILLLSLMLAQLPTVMAVFALILFIPITFSVSIGLVYILRSLSKKVPLWTSAWLIMLVMSLSLGWGAFPPDMRAKLHLEVPEDYQGNVYYFQIEKGESIYEADAHGCIYVRMQEAKDRRVVIHYGGDELNQDMLKGKVAMYFADLGGEQKRPFGSFYLGRTTDGLRIDKAKDPVAQVEQLHQRGVLRED